MPNSPLHTVGVNGNGIGDLRERNLALILSYLRDHGASSRAEIATACGLGVSTLTDLVNELRRRRLAGEADAIPTSGAGRPTRPITITASDWAVAGMYVDIDGASILIETVGGKRICFLARRVKVLDLGVEAGLQLLEDLLIEAAQFLDTGQRLVALELSLPGSIARDDGLVSWSFPLNWRDVAVRPRLERVLVSLGFARAHVGIDNDINCSALAALRSELDPVPSSMAFFGGDRGIGGGLIIDGQVFRGAHGGAGEFGHISVDPDRRECDCGRRGCLETRAGLVPLLVDSGALTFEEADRLVLEDPRGACDLVIRRAESGDRRMLNTLREAGLMMGGAVDASLAMLNPDIVVLGGFLGRLGNYFMEPILERIAATKSYASFRATQVLLLDSPPDRVVTGAVMAARDICLRHPLQLTFPITAQPVAVSVG